MCFQCRGPSATTRCFTWERDLTCLGATWKLDVAFVTLGCHLMPLGCHSMLKSSLSKCFSKLGGLGMPVSFQTFEYGFPNAPKDQRLRGVNVVRSHTSQYQICQWVSTSDISVCTPGILRSSHLGRSAARQTWGKPRRSGLSSSLVHRSSNMLQKQKHAFSQHALVIIKPSKVQSGLSSNSCIVACLWNRNLPSIGCEIEAAIDCDWQETYCDQRLGKLQSWLWGAFNNNRDHWAWFIWSWRHISNISSPFHHQIITIVNKLSPTWWSLLFIFEFLIWFPNPDSREI